MNAPTLILMDVDQHAGLPFPQSLPEFQRLFPGDAACAEYLEKVRWGDGFVCPHCGVTGEPFRISTRPGVLACRNCRRQTGLTVGTVMERSHTPLSTWFWAAYLAASQTQGMSAVQLLPIRWAISSPSIQRPRRPTHNIRSSGSVAASRSMGRAWLK